MNEQAGNGALDSQLFREVYLRAYIQEQQRIVQLKQQQQLVQKTLPSNMVAEKTKELQVPCIYHHPQIVFEQANFMPSAQKSMYYLEQQQQVMLQQSLKCAASAQHHYYQNKFKKDEEEKVKLQLYLHQQLLQKQQQQFHHLTQQQLPTNLAEWEDSNNNAPTLHALLADNTKTSSTVSFPLEGGYTLCAGESTSHHYSQEQQQKRKCSSSSAPSPATKRLRWEEASCNHQSNSLPITNEMTAQQLGFIQALMKQMQQNGIAAISPIKGESTEKEKTDNIEMLAFFTNKQKEGPREQETDLKKRHNMKLATEPAAENLAVDSSNVACPIAAVISSCSVTSPQVSERGSVLGERASTSVDTEEENFVDVVGGVEGVPSFTRAQRKAHIEFYRKIKALRNRENTLECRMCQKKIVNTESSIRSHVHSHTNSPLYVCKMCIKGYKEQHLIFEHISEAHPGKDHQFFEDRRDMNMLTELLMSCFPKCGPKCRSTYTQMLDQLLKQAADEALDKLVCQLCDQEVPCKRSSLIKHLHIHPSYKCKKCKFTSSEELEMNKHCRKEHPESSCGAEGLDKEDTSPAYNVSMALEVLSSTLKKCFSTHYSKIAEGTSSK